MDSTGFEEQPGLLGDEAADSWRFVTVPANRGEDLLASLELFQQIHLAPD